MLIKQFKLYKVFGGFSRMCGIRLLGKSINSISWVVNLSKLF